MHTGVSRQGCLFGMFSSAGGSEIGSALVPDGRGSGCRWLAAEAPAVLQEKARDWVGCGRVASLTAAALRVRSDPAPVDGAAVGAGATPAAGSGATELALLLAAAVRVLELLAAAESRSAGRRLRAGAAGA